MKAQYTKHSALVVLQKQTRDAAETRARTQAEEESRDPDEAVEQLEAPLPDKQYSLREALEKTRASIDKDLVERPP